MLVKIDIDFVKEVALSAGEKAIRMQGSFHTEFKSDDSYVTEIDREVEQYIQRRLREKYPDFAFHGEEFGRHGEHGAPTWTVDPIDGTTNMVFGIPVWCVSIGLIDEGVPVAGAIFAPRLNELFWATRGEGAFCNGERMRVTDRDRIHAEDTLGFTSGSIKNLNPYVLPGRIRCLGSIACDIAYTARGSYCSLVAWNEGAVDMGAALCMAHEAGCISEYLDGTAFDLSAVLNQGKTTSPFVVAPPQLAALLQSSLRLRVNE